MSNKPTRLGLAILTAALCMIGALAPHAKAMDTGYHPPLGPNQIITFTPTQLGIPSATALGSQATATGAAIVNSGIRALTVSFTSTHPYTATLTTYLDTAQTVTQEAVTADGATSAVVVLRTTVNYPFSGFKVKILNKTTTAGTCAVRYGLGQN
jgi:hypothetical protein